MFARLFPSEGKQFFGYFEQHAQKTLEAAKLLQAMLASPSDLADRARRIKEVEHEGDAPTRPWRRCTRPSLPRSIAATSTV